MALQKISTAALVLVRPSSTLEGIAENPGRHFVPSAVIFAVFVAFSLYSIYASYAEGTDAGAWQDPAPAMTAMTAGVYVRAAAVPLVVFAVAFYVGKRLGGTSDFKRIFSPLSHCLVPLFIGYVASLSGTWVYEHILAPHHGDGLGPSYVIDFAFSTAAAPGYIALPFLAWSVILSIKAVMVANHFCAKKSFGIIMLSGGVGMYLFPILLSIVQLVILESYLV